MNIIIVGCGKVGRMLAIQLNEAGNTVTVADTDMTRAKKVADQCDGLAVGGNGATHAVLCKAGIKTADLCIAVTGSDEQNLLCCVLAKAANTKCRTIARVRSPQYNEDISYFREELGLGMIINPEHAAAEEIARVLRFPSALKIDTFARGRVELIKFRLPENSMLCNKQLVDILPKLECDVQICIVERGEEVVTPNGSFVFQPKDTISIIAEQKEAYNFFRKIGFSAKQVHNAMIAGGGNITQYLCKLLENSGISLTVIEKDHARAEAIASAYEKVSVIEDDAVNQDVLLDEGIAKAEAFVALTDIDEENILLSLFARTVSDGKIITKINRIDFDEVIENLDLDTTIYPKNVTSELILRYVRAMKKTEGTNLETLYQIVKGKAEAVLFYVKEENSLTNKPISKMNLREGVLIAAIIRDKKVIKPRGSDSILRGDAVVIVTTQLGLHDMKDILK